MSLNRKWLRKNAVARYFCPKGHEIGWLVEVGNRIEIVGQDRTHALDPLNEPIYIHCRELKGVLPVDTTQRGNIVLTQRDVAVAPAGEDFSKYKDARGLPHGWFEKLGHDNP